MGEGRSFPSRSSGQQQVPSNRFTLDSRLPETPKTAEPPSTSDQKDPQTEGAAPQKPNKNTQKKKELSQPQASTVGTGMIGKMAFPLSHW